MRGWRGGAQIRKSRGTASGGEGKHEVLSACAVPGSQPKQAASQTESAQAPKSWQDGQPVPPTQVPLGLLHCLGPEFIIRWEKVVILCPPHSPPSAYLHICKVTYVIGTLFFVVFSQPSILALRHYLPWDISQCLSSPVVQREGKGGTSSILRRPGGSSQDTAGPTPALLLLRTKLCFHDG